MEADVKNTIYKSLNNAILFNGQRIDKSRLIEYSSIIGKVLIEKYGLMYMTNEKIEHVIGLGANGAYNDEKIYPKNVIDWFHKNKMFEQQLEHEKNKNSNIWDIQNNPDASIIAHVIIECHDYATNYGMKQTVDKTRGTSFIDKENNYQITGSKLFDIVKYVKQGGKVIDYLKLL